MDMTGNGKPKLSVFKGREAKLNRAVLLILAQEGPLNIRQVYKRVRTKKNLYHTRYRVVNRRIKSLEEKGYITQVSIKKTPQGFISKFYQPTTKTYLSFILTNINFEDFVNYAEQSIVILILAAFSEYISSFDGIT